MALKAIHSTQDEIPEEFRSLYSERDGKWELTGVEGVKTQADIDRIMGGLEKEKDDHKTTKAKLKVWTDMGLDTEQLHKDQDELKELRVQVEAHDGDDEERVAKLVDARVATKVAPLERELETTKAELETSSVLVVKLEGNERSRVVTDAVRTAAMDNKVVDTALDDILLLGERVFEIDEQGEVITRDGMGVTPGIAASIWFDEMKDKRPHWWPVSQGGGAGGSGDGEGFANNPFSPDHWNMTEQGRAVVADRPKAERMAKSAGTTIGGPKPVPKAPIAGVAA